MSRSLPGPFNASQDLVRGSRPTLLRHTVRFSAAALLSTAGIFLAHCGGGTSAPPPPMQDFAIVVSPAAASAPVGSVTAPVTVAITPTNGFTGTVTVTLQGLPSGISASPSASFPVMAGSSQSVSFDVADSAAVGASVLSVAGSSGALSHTAQITVTAEAVVHTSQVGSTLYLESGSTTDVARIGLETMWGGSITEVSVNGAEYVNRHDTGREVQLDFYDGSNPNWNPTLGGDIDNQGTPTEAFTVGSDSLYTKSLPLQWFAEIFGGGIGHPVAGDVQVEQTVTAVVSQAHTFKVHYKVTHLGSDLHTNTGSDFPAVYTNQNYKRFVYYGGSKPWTNDAVSTMIFPDLPNSGSVYGTEPWGALVDVNNMGLTVYTPAASAPMPGFGAPDPASGTGPTDNATNYFGIRPNWTIGPGFVFEGDVYLIAGDYRAAREIIYQLRNGATLPDISSPTATNDAPSAFATLSGVITVSGWAFDDVAVSRVEVLVDGSVDGIAVYGSSRPDVAAAYPQAPVNCGYSYSLATTKYSNGPHMLIVRATDSSGNVAVFTNIPVTVAN